MKKAFAFPVCAFLLAATVFASAESYRTGQLPSIVQRTIDETRAVCEKPMHLEPGFIVGKDVNGDGRKDYILDYAKLRCGGRETGCGSAGCVARVFVSLDDTYVEVLDVPVQGLRFGRVKGRPAILVRLRGQACGRALLEDCVVPLIWNGRAFQCLDPATVECRAL